MGIIKKILSLLPKNNSNDKNTITYTNLVTSYGNYLKQFYQYLPDEHRDIFINDGLYHKLRYLDMLQISFGTDVVELGSDKPFISHCLRIVNPESNFQTISIDMPNSPYPIIRLDIESEQFPFKDDSIDDVIFTEVLEHLFRDPSWTIFQISRILKVGGRLFLTTPNACSYDALQNILLQKNPNERNQFYAAIESGHPHLWNAKELVLLLKIYGLEIVELKTIDYYDIPKDPRVINFIEECSVDATLHGQALRVIAEKVTKVDKLLYPVELFPDGRPVKFTGALKEWVNKLELAKHH